MPAEPLHVLIATCGRCELLGRSLASLAECTKPEGYQSTLVIENGPPGRAREVVAAADPSLRCRHLHVSDANKSAALNAGLKQVGDCLVFFTDDDVRFHPDVLTAYARAAADARGCFFGGPTGADYEVEPNDWLRKYLPVSAKGWKLADGSVFDSNLAFLGFNWAAFSGDIRRIGGFNPHRGPGSATGSTGQETEMQSRLRSSGATPRYVQEAMVWHYIPAERCTAEWAVDRAYRHGVQCGLESERGSWTVLGSPPWVVGRLVKGALRAAIASMRRDPDFRMRARTRQSYNRGLASGFRQQSAEAGGR